MYCFSQICRLCLGKCTNELINLNTLDHDSVKIDEKLKFCVPEIVSDDTQLPENVCNQCKLFLHQIYTFKHMCIDNTNILLKYIDQLAGNIKTEHHFKLDLFVAMNGVNNTNQTESVAINDVNKTKQTEEPPETKKQLSEGTSIFSISLNQWDLFETKYTCRCVKEYNSFTENTSHLCRNCEGELHGFQLSKVKVGIAENRYNNIVKQNQVDSDDNNSIVSNDVTESNAKYEKGFDYNDFLLSKVHVNGVKKQIDVLSDENDVSFQQEEDIKPDIKLFSGRKRLEKIFQCPLCDKKYTRRYNLYSHYAGHPESKFFYCDKCRNKYIDENEYNDHQLIHERSEIKNESSIKQISNTLPDSNASDNEIEGQIISPRKIKQELNSSTDSLTCGTCDKVFDHKSHLAIHLMTHAGKQEYKCKICGEEFFRVENFKAHKKIHLLNRKFQCDQCHKSYDYKANLLRHKYTHGGKYLCSICSAQFPRKETLVDHIFQKHTKSSKQFPCSKCSEEFGHMDQLKSHELSAHSEKKNIPNLSKYTCKVCNKSFSSYEVLEVHKKRHAKKTEKKKIEATSNYCQICDRHFSVKTNMGKHMKTHTSGKIINCSICHAAFTNRYLMRQHFKTHSKELQFKCELCGKAYVSKSNLHRHVEVNHAR